MRPFFLSLLMLCAVSTAKADVLLFEDFEDAAITYTADPVDNLDDGNDWYGRIAPDTDSLPSGFVYSNLQGSGFYSAHDTDGVFGAETNLIHLDWENINIFNYGDLNLSWYVAEDDATSGEHWDNDSSLRIYAQIDGGGFNQIFGVESGFADNSAPQVDTDLNGVGDGAFITDAFAQFDADLTSGSTLDIRVVIEGLDGTNEDIAFDSLLLQGTAIPEPAGISLLMLGAVALGLRRRNK